MKIESEKFKDIQIAFLKKQVHEAQYENLLFKIKLAIAAAGLDPDKNYTMNENEMSVTEIPVQEIKRNEHQNSEI